MPPAHFPSSAKDRLVHALRHAFRPKYSQRRLRAALEELLLDRRLGDSRCRLVIPSFDCNSGRVRLFKTAHHERFIHDYQLDALEVAMATAAAPTYFPAFSTLDGQAFLDGGVWARCPIMIGLLEAVFVLGKAPASIEVLSIGTTETPYDVSHRERLGGVLTWNRQLVTLLMQAQIDGALAQAQIMTGKRAVRIDAVTRPGRFSLDDATQIEALRGLGMARARDAFDEVADRFLVANAPTFEPCHTLTQPRKPTPQIRPYVARRRRRRSLGVARTGLPMSGYRIVDISTTGALLETDGAVPVGTRLDLDLHLEDGRHAQVEGLVVRVQHPRWGVAAGIGVRFTGFQGNGRATLEDYVGEPRVAGVEGPLWNEPLAT